MCMHACPIIAYTFDYYAHATQEIHNIDLYS